MRVIRFDDRELFARRVTDFLMKHEAENCFFLGMIAGTELTPDKLMLSIEDAGEVVGVALKWPDRHLVMTDAPAAAVEKLVDYLVAAEIPAMGVQSRPAIARALVNHYRERTGVAIGPQTAMAVHVLTRVNPLPPVAGALRQATPADVDLLADWISAFCHDCKLPPPRDGEHGRARQRIERGETFLWEHDGRSVSTASLSGPTPNGIRISLVYTPPAHRGRGYATACVAALSRRMLDAGRQFCFLYTDLANPTSNKIYHAIGYERVCDSLQILFEGQSDEH